MRGLLVAAGLGIAGLVGSCAHRSEPAPPADDALGAKSGDAHPQSPRRATGREREPRRGATRPRSPARGAAHTSPGFRCCTGRAISLPAHPLAQACADGLATCPRKDSDGDKIVDPLDFCPALPESNNGIDDCDGCPDRSHAGQRPLQPVRFAPGSAKLGDTQQASLERIVAEYRCRTDGPRLALAAMIHESTSGEVRLAELRAQTVHDYLIDHGVAAEQLAGWGLQSSGGNRSMAQTVQVSLLDRTADAPALCLTEAQCGPRPLYPSRQCPDGTSTEGPGPCARTDDGRCAWLRLTCPPKAAKARPDTPAELLQSASVRDRLHGASQILHNREGLSVRERSDRYTRLLARNLHDPDLGVRFTIVAALGTLDDRVIPILQRARTRETRRRVIQRIEQVLSRRANPNAPPQQCTKRHRRQMMSWPVRELCDSLGRYPPILFSLPDGTNIYAVRREGKLVGCFRGRRKRPCLKKCLPGRARIATPSGSVAVRDLRVGDLVWTLSRDGERVARPVLRWQASPAPDAHRLVYVELVDGRRVRASFGHPLVSGVLGNVQAGDVVDGARVVRIENVPLRDGSTYDLLPAGSTGLYLADDVILKSTLHSP